MNTYKAYYKGKSTEVEADTTYHAQHEAARKLKAKKVWEVTVVLVQKDDQPIIHIAAD